MLYLVIWKEKIKILTKCNVGFEGVARKGIRYS